MHAIHYSIWFTELLFLSRGFSKRSSRCVFDVVSSCGCDKLVRIMKELVVVYCKCSILLHMSSMKNVGVARRIPDSNLKTWPSKYEARIPSTQQQYLSFRTGILTLWHSSRTLYIRIKNDLKYFNPQFLAYFLYQNEWLTRSPCCLCTSGCKLFKLLTQLIDFDAIWYETYAI